MGADLVADGAKDPMRNLLRVVTGIDNSVFLPRPCDGVHELEVAAALRQVNAVLGDLFWRGKDRGENKSRQILMALRELKDRRGHSNEALLTLADVRNGLMHQPETFVVSEIEDGAEQACLALEVVVKRGLGQAGGPENVLDRRAGVTLPGKCGDRRFQDRVARGDGLVTHTYRTVGSRRVLSKQSFNAAKDVLWTARAERSDDGAFE